MELILYKIMTRGGHFHTLEFCEKFDDDIRVDMVIGLFILMNANNTN